MTTNVIPRVVKHRSAGRQAIVPAMPMLAGIALLAAPLSAMEPSTQPSWKPIPRMQAVPQPYGQISFQRDEQEIARYHFGHGLRRPFVYPVIGPSGRPLTRWGHPHDPESHSHHYSVWISHNSVNGVSFWDDRSRGRIVHRLLEKLEDSDSAAAVTAVNEWIDEGGNNAVLLRERRRTEAVALADREWLLIIRLELSAPSRVVLGKTPFGMIGVRMAKSIGTNDGGGVIRNSEGAVNEKEVLWKPARWVDYSGQVASGIVEGITLMDHPRNPGHPTVFHVRGDGWMGASLTFNGERIIEPGQPLRLCYGLYVHSGMPPPAQIDRQWRNFGVMPAELSPAGR